MGSAPGSAPGSVVLGKCWSLDWSTSPQVYIMQAVPCRLTTDDGVGGSSQMMPHDIGSRSSSLRRLTLEVTIFSGSRFPWTAGASSLLHTSSCLVALPQSNDDGMRDFQSASHFTHPNAILQPRNRSRTVEVVQLPSWGHVEVVAQPKKSAAYKDRRMTTAHSQMSLPARESHGFTL